MKWDKNKNHNDRKEKRKGPKLQNEAHVEEQ
jgi:hypothetical protein